MMVSDAVEKRDHNLLVRYNGVIVTRRTWRCCYDDTKPADTSCRSLVLFTTTSSAATLPMNDTNNGSSQNTTRILNTENIWRYFIGMLKLSCSEQQQRRRRQRRRLQIYPTQVLVASVGILTTVIIISAILTIPESHAFTRSITSQVLFSTSKLYLCHPSVGSSPNHHTQSLIRLLTPRCSTTNLCLGTTTSSLSSSLSHDQQQQNQYDTNQSIDNFEHQSQLLQLQSESSTKTALVTTSSASATNSKTVIQRDTTHLVNNNVDGVIRWKDVLRSPYPLSCDLNDEECLKRQQLMMSSTADYAPDHNVLENDAEFVLTRKEQINLSLAILGTMITIVAVIVQSGPGAYRYYLAGAICATASHVIPVPIDTVKTRKQIDPKFSKLSFMAAFVSIWNDEGMRGLLAGLGPTAIGYACEGGIKFGVYETMKPIVTTGLCHISMMSSYLSFVQSRIVSFAICAAISGVAASIVLCPMEALRIRMVANPNKSQQQQNNGTNSGWFRTAVRMMKTEGITSFIKGMEPMIYKQVPYTITKNVSFDILTRYVYTMLQTTWQMTTIGPITKFVVPFLAAVAASILSCISSQPGDVLLSLVNAQQHDTRRTRDVIRDVLHSEKGWKGFYIGTKARLLHVGIVVTLQLLIYDLVKRICGIAATGIAK